MSSQERVARNFIRARGRANFRLLLSMLEEQKSGQEIGQVIGVTRERVRRWKDTFGSTICTYSVHPEVRRLAQR